MHTKPPVRSLAVVAAALAVASVAIAQTQTDVHRDAATRNVGDDTFMLQNARAFYCNLADDNNAIVVAARQWNNTTGANNNANRFPLTQIFDDVWFVGNRYVGQYMIKTPEGLVQVDSGNNASEVQLFNYPALQSLGLGAAYPLTGVFLTHGHGDHDGGAKWLLDNLGAKSWLGSADAAGKSYGPNLIASTDLSFREMNIGSKKFWVLPTPGHTPGSTSAVVPVKDWGKDVRVLINGGQSMTNSIQQVASYLDSIERTYGMAKALKVDAVMTPHIYWDGTHLKIDDIRANGRSQPSQFVYGHETVLRQLAVARECSAAWLTRLDATSVVPVWRYNTIQFLENPTPTKIVAKLSNGWNAVANRTVTFKVNETGASCTTTTNADGIASCDVRPLRPHTDKLTASFAGASSADFVDLPAETTSLVCSNGNCNAK